MVEAEQQVVDIDYRPAASLGAPADVTVLLSTFNGSRYLSDQLASFDRQTLTGWRLLWRDDGSSDDTVDLMARFASDQPSGRVVQAAGSGAHLGVFDSFMALLAQAADARAVALADQDDVWLPGKLTDALNALAGVDSDQPALYCTGLTVVDEDLRPVGESLPLRHGPGFPGALLQNIASGCTMVLNRAAVRAVLKATRPYHSVHDWWIYLLIAAIGGRILFDPKPSMLYRQHGANAIGASWSRSVIRRVAGTVRRGAEPYNAMLQQHLDALIRNETLLSPRAADGTHRIKASFEGKWWRRVGLLLMPGFRRQTPIQTVVLALWLLRGSRPLLRRWRTPQAGRA